MPQLSGYQVALVAWQHHFRSEQLAIAIAVAKAESGWWTGAQLHTSEEDSRGLWQINLYAHPQYNGGRLYDASYNAQAAWEVYSDANHTWRPWTTYTRGTYRQYMDEAYNAVEQLRQTGYNPGGTGTFGPAGSDGGGGTVTQELHARWDYTPIIDGQVSRITDFALDMQHNGDYIYGFYH